MAVYALAGYRCLLFRYRKRELRKSESAFLAGAHKEIPENPAWLFEVNPKVRQIFELSDLKGLVFVLSRCQALQL